MSRRVALVTGVTGQDGAYLTRLLLDKGYEVHGVVRRSSSFNSARIASLYRDPRDHETAFFLHYGDLTDTANLTDILRHVKPDEVYNLAAQSNVAVSFKFPEYTSNVNALGVSRLLEALRGLDMVERVRFYQASTSELFGGIENAALSEGSPFRPRSPYAISKLHAFWTTVMYRDAYGMHASNGILFNHESPLRGETFVTRKITRAVAAIEKGQQETLYLGNLDARRDWGHARDYVEGMWLMLQKSFADDYVLATGETHSVREFVEHAFGYVDRKIDWNGTGVEEVGHDRRTGQQLIRIDERYFRPNEVEALTGDAGKARDLLGWSPSTDFKQLVSEMVAADLAEVTPNPPIEL